MKRCFRYSNGSVGVQLDGSDRIVVTPWIVFGQIKAIKQIGVFRNSEALAFITYNPRGYPYVHELSCADTLADLRQNIFSALEQLRDPQQYSPQAPDVKYVTLVLELQASSRFPGLTQG